MNIKNHKNTFGAGLATLAFSTMLTSMVQAQTCTAVPTCEELGYDLSAADCTGKRALKCPFDKSKYFCADCTQNGGANNVICGIGDILYSDMSCSHDVISDKTPIAIVFEPYKRLALALNTTHQLWSQEQFDVPNLTNYDSPESALNDWNGQNNTNIVFNYCKAKNKNCPAFAYVTSYKTEGTNAGDWYLPAYGELIAFLEIYPLLNRSLLSVGGAIIEQTPFYYWSSSERDASVAWLQIGIDIPGCYPKDESFAFVRPVLQF